MCSFVFVFVCKYQYWWVDILCDMVQQLDEQTMFLIFFIPGHEISQSHDHFEETHIDLCIFKIKNYFNIEFGFLLDDLLLVCQ